MKLGSETLYWLNWQGHHNLAKKITERIELYSENNPDDVGSVFLEALLELPTYKEAQWAEWNSHVIPLFEKLDQFDFFGTEGWEHHVGLTD